MGRWRTTMSCDPRDILLYVEGELSPDDAARVRSHAASCAECRERLAEEQRLVSALDSLGDLPTPAGFADETVTRARCDLTHAVTNPRERRRAAVFVASLAGASALLLWPSGLFSPAITALAPARCFGRFLCGWTGASFSGALIVGRTLAAYALSETRLPIGVAVALLALVVGLLVALVARDRRADADARRGPVG